MRILLLVMSVVFVFSAVSAQNTKVSTEMCYNITWYGGAAGTAGKTVKGKLKQDPYIIKYDWKNGVMNYDWIHEDGMILGMKGTWKQDGSNGTFEAQRSGSDYIGTWSSPGNNKKNKLTFKSCD